MKRTGFFLLAILCAWSLSGCTTTTTPAANSNANSNSNANAAKPVAAAPSKDALLDMDKKANEAWMKGDKAYFDGFLSDKAVMYGDGMRMFKADMLNMIGSTKCDVKTWNLEDPQMATIDADTVVLSYKGTFDGSCSGADGKSQKIPSPVRAASVYTRDGDKWKAVFHGENLIMDPKNPPAAPKAEDKKEQSKKEEPKKEEKKDDKAASNSNSSASAPAKPTADPNTDALTKLHQSGWEAFKAKDAKKFEDMTSSNLSIVSPEGTWVGTKADVIKGWTTMDCQGINTVKVSDGFATALSPTVEIFTAKGTADGTCNGHKNGDLYQTAFYVKEGNDWKLAFMFEAPPTPGM